MKPLLVLTLISSIAFSAVPTSEVLVGASGVILKDTSFVVPNVTVKVALDSNVNINISIAGNSKFQYVKAGADISIQATESIKSKRDVVWNFGVAGGKVATLQNTNGIGVSVGNSVRFSRSTKAVWVTTVGCDVLFFGSIANDIPVKYIGTMPGISSGIRVEF